LLRPLLSLSVPHYPRTYPDFIARFSISIVYVSRDIVRVYLYMYTRDCRRGAARRRTALRCYGALTAPSVREVFLALDFPPGIITSRSVQIRDYSPDCRGDRTKSARACGTSTEEIFLTTRCHRVRPTEITDEDSERSSTPVTLQECAGGRSPPSPPPSSILARALSCRIE